jgi:NADPH-dependent curcumin reductase CurA
VSRDRAPCIDVCFDHTGGPVLDTVLEQLNLKARIALCGMISH